MIQSILEEAKLAERRGVTIAIEEYFKLLLAFNKRGIHFRNISASSDKPLPGLQEDVDDPFSGKFDHP